MTENYYLVQHLLPLYFSNATNRDFFYKVIASSKENIKVFFEKEIYGWTKRDLHRIQIQDKHADVTQEEKEWKYLPIVSEGIVTEDKKWNVVFVQFPPDFVNRIEDSLTVAICMQINKDNVEKVRLFMLEVDLEVNNTLAMSLCEKELDNKYKHNNLCKINSSENFLNDFTDKVMETIQKND